MKPSAPLNERLGGSSVAERSKHVFCFGDSLTAGTSPPEREEHPYGKHLRDALLLRSSSIGPAASGEDDDDGGGSEEPSVTVDWLGLPGWTSSSLLEEIDLRGVLERTARDRRNRRNPTTLAAADATAASADPPPPFDLVIVLAGTNDLAYETDPGPIVESVKGIHAVAHGLGCPTVALGIPTSGYQSVSKPARTLAGSVNRALESWAEETTTAGDDDDAAAGPRVRYVPHPIESYDPSPGGLWSPDGLHFSPKGYRFVGDSLAPIVAEMLRD